jgi:glycosyltransferase involved in cell wall biosynthesis
MIETRTSQEPSVALVYGDYPPKPPGEADGGADFIQQLGKRLASRGFAVTAVVSKRDDRPGPYVEDGVRVAPIIQSWRLGRATREELTRVRRLLAAEHVALVHLVYPDPYIRYGSDSYHLPFALKTLGLPMVTTFFGFGVTKSSVLTKAGLLSLFASTDALVITDWDLLERFKRRFPFWRQKATGGLVGSIAGGDSPRWSAAALTARQARLGLPQGFRYVGFFGFWLPGKGLEELIRSIAGLRAGGVRVRLALIGGREPEHRTGYELSILDLARQAGIEDSVIDTGPLPAEEVVERLVAMDVCVLPFQANPLGRSSLALALTLGVPTVVTRPAAGEELLKGVALLDRPDAEHIAGAVRAILASPAEQQGCAAACVAAASHWSWDAVVDQYADIYRKLAARRRDAARR